MKDKERQRRLEQAFRIGMFEARMDKFREFMAPETPISEAWMSELMRLPKPTPAPQSLQVACAKAIAKCRT